MVWMAERLRHMFVAHVYVGSNPTLHPKKNKLWDMFFAL